VDGLGPGVYWPKKLDWVSLPMAWIAIHIRPNSEQFIYFQMHNKSSAAWSDPDCSSMSEFDTKQ